MHERPPAETSQDGVHRAGCQDRSCFRCVFLRNQKRWRQRTLIPGLDISWLVARSTPEWGLGCSVCHLTQQDSEYARFEVQTRRLGNIVRHADCDQHLAALVTLGMVDDSGLGDKASPTVAQFKAVAQNRLTAVALRQGEKEVGGRNKLTVMQECIGQAMFEADRRFLSESACVCLHMDVRNLRLLVRFRAATSDLRCRAGVLGVLPLPRTTATALQEGLRTILEWFCTDFSGNHLPEMQQDIIRKIEMLDMDAASDEQCMAREIRRGILNQVRFVMRDKTHAARRALSRPWDVIPEVKEGWLIFAGSSSSMVRAIQNSAVLQALFNEYSQRQSDTPCEATRVKNLQMRAHRFDSVAKPLGRGILFYEAVVMVAVWCTVHRRSKAEVDVAELFLEWLSAERLVLLAMMADASDCALGFVRAFDTEESDPAETMLECQRFLSELHHLFTAGHCTESGYTEHMLHQLKTSKGFLVKGRGKTVGGPDAVTPAMIAKARETMRLYTSLAAEVVSAEYPAFELLQSFCIFDVQPRKTPMVEDALLMSSAERLCQAFHVEQQVFVSEYLDHRPIALNEARAKRLSNAQAWASAVQRTSARTSTAKNHPSSVLRKVLWRYLSLLV